MNGHNVKTDKIPLPYWRAALAEISLLNPIVSAESKPIEINPVGGGAWQVTSAEPDVPTWVKAQFAASKAQAAGSTTKTIPYVLIAARLSEQASHGVKKDAIDINKGLSVLCIPCLLDRSGTLWPDPDRHPWIPRDFLEPTVNALVVGRLEDYDGFISTLPGKAMSFDDVLQMASDLFAAITEARLPTLPVTTSEDDLPPVFEMNGYELVAEWHGIPYDPPIAPRQLIRLYDNITAKSTPKLPLLDSLRTTTDRPSQKPPLTQEAEKWHTNTIGHINREHPLSPSQREAMVELARLKDGQILAVNGPPGTGKTTLLQSVAAQLWVDAALQKADCPLIVVTSTNVKAVENVLDSFAKICADIKHQRWHPYDGGFGLFLASESRESKHPTCTSKGNPYAEHETANAVEAAEAYYLGHASELFKEKQTSVSEVVKLLHKILQHYAQKLKAIVAARYAVYRTTQQGVNDGAETSCKRLLAQLQQQIDALQAAIQAADRESAACKVEERAAESDYESAWNKIGHAEKDWNAYLANSPLWLDLLAFIPPIRARRMARDRFFLMSNPLTSDRQHRDDGLQQHFDALRKQAMERKTSVLSAIHARRAASESQRTTLLERYSATKQAWSKIDDVFQRWQNALKDGHESMLDVSLDDLNKRLDLALRAPMFSVADWYWSGCWLLEMQDRLKTGETDSKGRIRLEAKYRRFAKLSPCLVSNFHVAPSFFTAWQGEDMPFWNTIDLLIVDEAGQVSPDVGAAMFALAKRALVVGDTYQIEPVWNSGEGTDRANAMKFGLTSAVHDPHYDMLAGSGYTSASGNLMRIANRSCTVQKYDDMRGLMLTEHRRCVPELIDYCNTLIYSGRLEPKRESIPRSKRILPAFGHLNVAGRDKKVGSSRQNYDEAKAIVEWLKVNRAALEEHYVDDDGYSIPLWKLVGIVTPFASQAGVIERHLRKEMPDLMLRDSKLTVGTVHALQGAERAIVIFSPTYGESFTGGAFFDQKPNMLNVAVSRAKDSFLVIGNLALLDAQKRSRPSGLLASYLFHGNGSAALPISISARRMLA